MARGDRPGSSGLDLIAEAWAEYRAAEHTNPLDLPISDRQALHERKHAAADRLDMLLGTDTKAPARPKRR